MIGDRKREPVEAVETRADGDVALPVRFTEQAWAAIRQLRDTGLFGISADEVIERLVCDRIQELTLQGWVAPRRAGEVACRECGCTEERACDGGCWWVEPDLCSACAMGDER